MDSLIPADFLRLLAGDLCPCGHDAADHDAASVAIPGERFGRCSECSCAGVIDMSDQITEE